ncbi:carbohydrate ABC transporter permease [Microbacterium invictum]|uniref:Carbohydrate ABC transporter permease n=1 Tax=Microbacterium invictum TaxID=515415 RepID=A0ABZ0VAP8_9MICO|nr:carbohydrate ABC transporter permease [Microbacterium invictum]WQB70707.1 carbohydrate ABC transporter permease [Microbacterium invictum]
MAPTTTAARVGRHIPLIILAVFAAFPLFVLVTNSLKSRTELALNPIGLPQNPQFGNFVTAWQDSDFALHAANSLLLVFSTVACVLVLAGLAAYNLARLEPRGSGAVLFYMLAVTAFPIWLYLVPLFFTWRTLGLLNNFVGLIIIYTAINSPLAIFLLRSYLVRIPREIEEAAYVDGATKLQVLVRIILPISWTGFLTVGLVVAVAVWGEFQIAFVMLQDQGKLPVTTSFTDSPRASGKIGRSPARWRFWRSFPSAFCSSSSSAASRKD